MKAEEFNKKTDLILEAFSTMSKLERDVCVNEIRKLRDESIKHYCKEYKDGIINEILNQELDWTNPPKLNPIVIKEFINNINEPEL